MKAKQFTVDRDYLNIAWPFLVVAFLLRLSILFLVPSHPVGDQRIFLQLAISLANGAGFSDVAGHPTSFFSPGYPFFISVFYSLFGTTDFFLKSFQVLLSIATLGITGFFSYRIGGRFTGRVALAFGTLYPADIFYTNLLYSEVLSAFCVTSILLLLYPYLMEKKRVRLSSSSIIRWGSAGLIASFISLIHPFFLLFVPLLGIAVIVIQRTNKRLIVLLATLAFTVSIIPSGYWSIRNNHLFGVPWPSSNTGTQFWIGNHEGTTGGYPWTSSILPTETRQQESYNLFVHSATKYITTQPHRFIKSIPSKIRYAVGSDYGPIVESFFNDEFDDFNKVTQRTPLLLLLFNWFLHTVIFFAGWAAWWFAPRGHWRYMVAAGIILPLLVSIFFYGLPRLFFPFTPLIIIAASQLPVDHDKFFLGTILWRFSFMLMSLFLIFVWGLEAAAFLSLI